MQQLIRARWSKAAPLVGLLLFAGALWVLHRELSRYHYHDLIGQLRSLRPSALLLATLFAALSYLALTTYDMLSLRYMEHPLPYRRSSLAAFLGYAISQNIGLSFLSGAPIRFRLYAVWGLSSVEITTLVAFNALSFWIGLMTVGGLVFAFGGAMATEAVHLPASSVRALGGLFLFLVAVYVARCLRGGRTIHFSSWEIRLPRPRLAVAQIAVGAVDWGLAAAVLYVLLRSQSQVTYLSVVSIFMLAQIVGIVSQVPGGAGVFESAVLILLPASVSTKAAFGALIAFRVIYYLLPLGIAVIVILLFELREHRFLVRKMGRQVGAWFPVVVPHILALSTFFGGVVLLVSGSTPSVGGRLAWLNDFLPLPVLEISHLLGSAAGMGLLLLAWGLQRRLESAYYLTAVMLACGSLFSILKGLDYEEASILAVMLAALLPARRQFYRRTSLTREPLSSRWLVAAGMVLMGSLWLGFLAYHHVAYSNELWWRFALFGDAPRFLRLTIAVSVTVAVFGLARLFGPAVPRPHTPGPAEMSRIRAVVAESPRSSAHLALLGDKRFLLSANGNAFLMYAVQDRSWVAMGDAVGPEEERDELYWQFHAMTDRNNAWSVFYEVDLRDPSVFLDLGLSFLKIGEEAIVDLAGFSLEGKGRKALRYNTGRLERDGSTFEVLTPERTASALADLKEISDLWLAQKKTREKGFSVGRFDEAYLSELPVAVVRQGARIAAFASIWQGAPGGEMSIDLMRFHPEAASGTMDYLLTKLMLWGKEEGFSTFNLGMAPLAGLRVGPIAPLWNRLAVFVYTHGEQFYNFQGLRQYKDKFDPRWVPRYLVCPGGHVVPRVLTDLAELISGGLWGAVAK